MVKGFFGETVPFYRLFCTTVGKRFLLVTKRKILTPDHGSEFYYINSLISPFVSLSSLDFFC